MNDSVERTTKQAMVAPLSQARSLVVCLVRGRSGDVSLSRDLVAAFFPLSYLALPLAPLNQRGRLSVGGILSF